MSSASKSLAHIRRSNLPMAAVEAMPESVFATVYNRATPYDLSRPAAGATDRDLWQLDTGEETWTLPRVKDTLRITHIGQEPERRVLDKYLDATPFDASDLAQVVDVGAYIGEFSHHLTERGADVLAVEPDPLTAECLSRNVPDARVRQAAAWSEDTHLPLAMGADPSESTALAIDEGAQRGTQTVPARTVEQICTDANLSPDLVKIEAEGAEPEALAGAVGLACPLVVDVSPERAGASTYDACRALLRSHGYETTLNAQSWVLYADPNGGSDHV